MRQSDDKLDDLQLKGREMEKVTREIYPMNFACGIAQCIWMPSSKKEI